MASTQQKFQCYLIIGSSQASQNETEQIAKSHSINLKHQSPDIFLITPEKQNISIEEVRSLKKHIFQKPVDLPFKLVIFREAHKLTHQAQNALLKILEEPPEKAIIILEAKNKESLLPTVRSRLVTIEAKRGQETSYNFYMNKSLPELLKSLPDIKNHLEWLDNQIGEAHGQIKKNAAKSKKSPKSLLTALDMCITTKKMITANVNPAFAIANLFLQTAKAQ